MWVEQSVNFSRYQLHAVSYLVLFIVTGVLGTLSVLPMQSFWYLAAAFAAGATLAGVILGLQTVGMGLVSGSGMRSIVGRPTGRGDATPCAATGVQTRVDNPQK